MTFQFLIIFHCFACIWIILGNCSPGDGSDMCFHAEGWRLIDDRIGFYPEHLKIWHTYSSAFYFITTTGTTVGYGDYNADTVYERLYLIVVEFAGICIFSVITGNIR